MGYETILYQKSAGIGLVTLNRAHLLNAINLQMRLELFDFFSQVETDPEIRVIVITGAGERAFSAGADIKELKTSQAKQGWDKWRSVGVSSKPVIAAIRGHCLGAALQMVLRCDLRIASEDAQFGLPEISLNMIISDGGTQRLPRLAGIAKALEMLLTGEMISAREAYHFHLLNKVVPSDQLPSAANKLAEAIASKNPNLVKIYKEAIWRGCDLPLQSALKLEEDLFRRA